MYPPLDPRPLSESPTRDAILLAPQVIGGQKVRYIFLDDASDPATAVQNVKRLISQDNVDVLLGPSTTPTTIGGH